MGLHCDVLRSYDWIPTQTSSVTSTSTVTRSKNTSRSLLAPEAPRASRRWPRSRERARERGGRVWRPSQVDPAIGAIGALPLDGHVMSIAEHRGKRHGFHVQKTSQNLWTQESFLESWTLTVSGSSGHPSEVLTQPMDLMVVEFLQR